MARFRQDQLVWEPGGPSRALKCGYCREKLPYPPGGAQLVLWNAEDQRAALCDECQELWRAEVYAEESKISAPSETQHSRKSVAD